VQAAVLYISPVASSSSENMHVQGITIRDS
jgi:hypothetical protein